MELPLLDKWQLFLILRNYLYRIAAILVESQLHRIISTLIKNGPFFLWNHHYFHGIATIRQLATIFNITQLFIRNRS